MRKKKGQSILEYVIILAAIVTAVIAVGRNVIQTQTETMFEDAADVMDAQTLNFQQQAAGGPGE